MRSVLIGAGTYGEVYLAYLQEAGIDIVGFLDDDPKYEGQSVRGVPVLGGVSRLNDLKETENIEAGGRVPVSQKCKTRILNS